MSDKKRERRILELQSPMDYGVMMEVIEQFVERYPWMSVSSLGKSILGRRIPLIRLGNDILEKEKCRVLYVGAHHGMEWITTALLLRFINEYCELLKSDGMAEGIRVKSIYDRCGIYVLPMLNPDGVDYAVNGVGEDNVLYDRLLSMNGGSHDFSHWQANARGVDLNHNYNAGFSEYKVKEAENGIFGGAPTRYSGEYPESEPETAYLCNFLRFQDPFDAVLTFHSQGEEIYYTSLGQAAPNSERLGKYLARVSGYQLRSAEGLAAFGGLTDWFIKAFLKPAFTLECGKGSNPLPISQMPMIYLKLRKALFELPMIV